MAIPFVARLRRIGEDRGLSVVAVSQDDADSTGKFRERLGVDLPILYDPAPWRASRVLGLASVPTFVCVGSDGKVDRLVVGLQREKLEGFAERAAALAGRPSRPFFRADESVPFVRPG
jgi:peroxiredoxin